LLFREIRIDPNKIEKMRIKWVGSVVRARKVLGWKEKPAKNILTKMVLVAVMSRPFAIPTAAERWFTAKKQATGEKITRKIPVAAANDLNFKDKSE
jgi:hypothetical protein